MWEGGRESIGILGSMKSKPLILILGLKKCLGTLGLQFIAGQKK